MSTEAVLTLVGILVGIALFAFGGIASVIGFLLLRAVKQFDQSVAMIHPMDKELTAQWERIRAIEKFINMPKQATPSVRLRGDTSA